MFTSETGLKALGKRGGMSRWRNILKNEGLENFRVRAKQMHAASLSVRQAKRRSVFITSAGTQCTFRACRCPSHLLAKQGLLVILDALSEDETWWVKKNVKTGELRDDVEKTRAAATIGSGRKSEIMVTRNKP